MMNRMYPAVARTFLGPNVNNAFVTQQRNLAKRSLSRQNARALERQTSEQNIKDNAKNLWSENVFERQHSAKKRVVLTRKKTMKQVVVGEKTLMDRLPQGTSGQFIYLGGFVTFMGAVGVLSNSRVEDARHFADKVFRANGDPKQQAGYSGYWRMQSDPENAAQFAHGGSSAALCQKPSEEKLVKGPHLRYEWVTVA